MWKKRQRRVSTLLKYCHRIGKELEYRFLLAHDLNYLSDPNYKALGGSVIEIKRMPASLIRKVEAERLAS
jgi:hypothetical protein